MSRLDLLCHVSSVPLDAHAVLSCTLTHTRKSQAQLMVRSDTDILRPAHSFGRSTSVPVGMMGPDKASHLHQPVFTHQPRRRGAAGERLRRSASSILQDLVVEDKEGRGDKPQHVLLIEQLFSFIGSEPERAVSCGQFLQVGKLLVVS